MVILIFFPLQVAAQKNHLKTSHQAHQNHCLRECHHPQFQIQDLNQDRNHRMVG